MWPKLSTGYPQPVDFLCVDIGANFFLYDQALKIPEKLWANFLLYDSILEIPENVDKSI